MSNSIQSTAARCLDTDAISTDKAWGVLEDICRRVDELVSPALHPAQNATIAVSEERKFVNTSNPSLSISNSHKEFHTVDFSLLQRNPVRPKVTLHALQEWEGYVVDIREDEFVVRLVDLTAGRTYESEEAVIPLTEISENDASRMVIGSIFRWVIGYERSVEGTRKRVSHIVFRDLPKMTEDDFQRGREWAQSVMSAFDGD